MNERIKELMFKAGYAAPEMAGRANKLAELIVKECCEVAHCNFHVDGLTLGTILKEHFGVGSEIDTQLRNRSTYFGSNP